MDPDFIVSDLLSELKAENERKSKLVKGLVRVICGSVIAILALVAGFLLYLYADIDTTNATGVYAVVDSSGNVIASDLTSDEINQILEVIAANGTNYENASTVED